MLLDNCYSAGARDQRLHCASTFGEAQALGLYLHKA